MPALSYLPSIQPLYALRRVAASSSQVQDCTQLSNDSTLTLLRPLNQYKDKTFSKTMSQPILSIEESAATSCARANLLPCRIHHDGPVDPIDTFWSPTSSQDGKRTAYFRGRKLKAETTPLPESYRGVVVERVPKAEAPPAEEGEKNTVETGSLTVTGTFEEVAVWGHEEPVDRESDGFVRGVEEWLNIADKIHSYGPSGKVTE